MNKDILSEYGVNYKDGIARCLNDEAMYGRMLRLFLADSSMERARAAFAEKKYDALYRCVHELKGVSGNASLTELFASVCALVDYIRKGGADEQMIETLFIQTENAYEHVKNGITLALDT